VAPVTAELEGRTILITGGSMGIGYACARELIDRGARVFIAARGKPALDEALKQLRLIAPGRVDGASADVSVSDSVDELFAQVKTFGDLTGLVHAAGIYGPIGTITQVDPADWFDAVRINLFGTFLVTRAACRAMSDGRQGGSIVLLSGGGAATPFPNYTAYASSKVAVARLAETVALEVAPDGIRVNSIAPGFVATRLHQQTLAAGEGLAGDFLQTTKSRLAEGAVPPEVAARAVAFLLSDRSRYITGRFLAAPYDDFESWPDHLDKMRDSDLFTLRRIVPRDRGMDWQ
jgi:NAD(P)-dependent dehydrogenase (short-subunit alcohol dehydrogenase family)